MRALKIKENNYLDSSGVVHNQQLLNQILDKKIVYESGNNGNGNWIKFSDGTMICYINTSISNFPIQNAYGSLYQNYLEWNFPQSFVEIPSVICGLFKWGNGASWGTVGDTADLNSVLLRCIDVLPRSEGACKLNAIAVGRWKNTE